MENIKHEISRNNSTYKLCPKHQVIWMCREYTMELSILLKIITTVYYCQQTLLQYFYLFW